MDYNDDYYNFEKYTSLKGQIQFEILSWYGRNLKFRRTKLVPGKFSEPLLLDIGAGTNYKKGWIHADFFSYPRVKFWKKYAPKLIPELELDLRYPIRCPDNVIDGVYSGHTLEHLYPKDAISLLKEIHRILKPGCFLRINIPDLEYFVAFYNGEHNDLPNSTGCEAISDICQNWGHRSLWDEKLLVKTLLAVGFINVRKVPFGKDGDDKRLIKEEEVRETGTLVIEAQKAAL